MKKKSVEYSPFIANLIAHWEKQLPEHAGIFRDPEIEILLLALNNRSYDKNNCKAIDEFVKGLILISINQREKDLKNRDENLKLIEALTIAGTELIRDYLKTDYKDYVINTNLLPGHFFSKGDQIRPINVDAIKIYSDRINKSVLTPDDVDFVSQKCVTFFRTQYDAQAESEANSRKQKTNRFKTNLTDNERQELCNRIIVNKGAERKGELPLFKDIFEIHKLTLHYLLGGERPENIVPIKIPSHRRIYDLLKSISKEPHPYMKGEFCVPDFVKTNICSELLRNKNGLPFEELVL